ncbi:hypothetical protein E5329_25940 [Petralouisia muris]|uniref:Uncharacterized protein n=1 Tax=Petralouisia muris TaxID=3032872 RepID=A0AC61RNK6_9FIRM|nr:hypothetical protein E5329_25940 [Petralouisia muris]
MRRCSAPLTGCPGCATSQDATGDISSRAAPFPWIGKGQGIGSNRFPSNRCLSTPDMWTISNFKALPRKGFRPWFYGGWYNIIPHPRFIEILSTFEFMGGFYEQ